MFSANKLFALSGLAIIAADLATRSDVMTFGLLGLIPLAIAATRSAEAA